MAAPNGGMLNNEQIIQDFIYKVSNLVEYSSLKSNHPMFSRKGSTQTQGGISVTANNSSGGAANMTVASYGGASHASPIGKPALNALGAAGTMPLAATVKTVLKSWMEEYAKVRRVNLRNSGNSFLNTSQSNFVVRFTNANAGKLTAVQNQFDTDAAVITAGTIIDGDVVNDFINKCQDNWVNNCHATATETLSYNYCHSNHINHSSHGSRGRR